MNANDHLAFLASVRCYEPPPQTIKPSLRRRIARNVNMAWRTFPPVVWAFVIGAALGGMAVGLL